MVPFGMAGRLHPGTKRSSRGAVLKGFQIFILRRTCDLGPYETCFSEANIRHEFAKMEGYLTGGTQNAQT